ncbi:glutathione S-transferase family protein [Leeia oryzae]|uniref:glutathione S-transferase family protein n=1 Tax=Leeia oryzae TaxID=356662 RepID=UPI00037FF1DD|nr:glutathione S-transferase N-terminal domain-containing protein [Leeia oryzae]
MLTILGKPTSINVRKVLWTCAEIGVSYELQPWGDPGMPTSAPEFLRWNPRGLVPVLRDGNETLWESNTICRYLAGKHGRTDLLPSAPLPRAHVEKWMDWQATELNNAWRYAFMGLVRKSEAHTDPKAIAASGLAWNQMMGILDSRLAETGAFVTGDEFTVADIVLGLSVHRWVSTPIEHAELPAVNAYYERLSERPGFVEFGRNHAS